MLTLHEIMLTLHYHCIEVPSIYMAPLVSMVPFATKGKDRSQVKTESREPNEPSNHGN